MNLRRYRDFVIVLLALAVPFWFLRASMRDPTKQSTGPDRIIVRIAAPIQYAAATLARGVSNLWGDYVYLVDVKEDNRTLASQNAPPPRAGPQARGARGREPPPPPPPRAAAEPPHRRGERPGDRQGHQRVLPRGARLARPRGPRDRAQPARALAGRRRRHHAEELQDTVDVRLVVDAGSGVDVVVQRTGARGFVRGAGDERSTRARSSTWSAPTRSRCGDLLVTSGVGRRFPKGIPVATVTQVVKRDFGIYQEVHRHAHRRLLPPGGGAHRHERAPLDETSTRAAPGSARARRAPRAPDPAARRGGRARCATPPSSRSASRSWWCRATSSASSTGCTSPAPRRASCSRWWSSWACTSTRWRAARRSRSPWATCSTSSPAAPVGLFTFITVATFVVSRAAGVRLAAQTLHHQGRARARLRAGAGHPRRGAHRHLRQRPGARRARSRSWSRPTRSSTAIFAPFVFSLAERVHAATITVPRPGRGGAAVSLAGWSGGGVRLAGERGRSDTGEFKRRFQWIALAMAVLFLGLVVRLFQLQILEHDDNRAARAREHRPPRHARHHPRHHPRPQRQGPRGEPARVQRLRRALAARHAGRLAASSSSTSRIGLEERTRLEQQTSSASAPRTASARSSRSSSRRTSPRRRRRHQDPREGAATVTPRGKERSASSWSPCRCATTPSRRWARTCSATWPRSTATSSRSSAPPATWRATAPASPASSARGRATCAARAAGRRCSSTPRAPGARRRGHHRRAARGATPSPGATCG